MTPRDLLEAIAGEFKPETPDEASVTRRQDGSLLLGGIISIPEMKDVLDIRSVPLEEEARYQTLAGMIMLLLGRMPKEGDIVDWGGWRFEVVDMDGRRIDKVIASRPSTGAVVKAALVKIGKPIAKAADAAVKTTKASISAAAGKNSDEKKEPKPAAPAARRAGAPRQSPKGADEPAAMPLSQAAAAPSTQTTREKAAPQTTSGVRDAKEDGHA